MNSASAVDAADLVTTAPSPAFVVAVVLYVVAALGFTSVFVNSPSWVLRSATGCLLLGFLAHGVDIGWRGVEGVHPGTSVREALGFLSWALVGGYLLAARKSQVGVAGAFLAPGAAAVLAVARLSPPGVAVADLTSLGRIHIALATVGVAVFALAAAVAGVYLVQDRNLKRKHFEGAVFRGGVALEPLDRLLHRLILLGFPLFTLALTLGAIWGAQRPQSLLRPEYPFALVTWVSFAVFLVGRSTRGWRGRKAAILTVVGFAASTIVLAIYLLRRALGA